MALTGTMAGGLGGASTGGGLGWLGNLGGLFSGGSNLQNIANPTPLQMGEQINQFMDAQKMQQMFGGFGGQGGMGLGQLGLKMLAANQPTTNPYKSGLSGLMSNMDMGDLTNLMGEKKLEETLETPIVAREESPMANLPPWITPTTPYERPDPVTEQMMKYTNPFFEGVNEYAPPDVFNKNVDPRFYENRINDPMFDTQNPYYTKHGRYGGGY